MGRLVLPEGSSIEEIKRIEAMQATLQFGIEWTVSTMMFAKSEAEWNHAVRKTGSKFIRLLDIALDTVQNEIDGLSETQVMEQHRDGTLQEKVVQEIKQKWKIESEFQ